jgi:hypothetical protein
MEVYRGEGGSRIKLFDLKEIKIFSYTYLIQFHCKVNSSA